MRGSNLRNDEAVPSDANRQTWQTVGKPKAKYEREPMVKCVADSARYVSFCKTRHLNAIKFLLVLVFSASTSSKHWPVTTRHALSRYWQLKGKDTLPMASHEWDWAAAEQANAYQQAGTWR